jgi:hypothetical protein
MGCGTFARSAVLLIVSLSFSGIARAQTVCDEGNGALDPAQPAGIAPAEIIQKVAAKEAIFKAAREQFGYTMNISVQTVALSGKVDGEFRQISEVRLGDDGKREERMTFAPESTLGRIFLTEDDLEDIRQRLPFALTPEELPMFSISYVGQQPVDQLKAYVFDVSPKNAKKEKKFFKGRIWVDDQELAIVKTCGKPREDENPHSTKKNAPANLTPLFVTYREQIGGQYWFPTYSRANEFLEFPKGLVHIREVVKYSNYKPLVAK